MMTLLREQVQKSNHVEKITVCESETEVDKVNVNFSSILTFPSTLMVFCIQCYQSIVAFTKKRKS